MTYKLPIHDDSTDYRITTWWRTMVMYSFDKYGPHCSGEPTFSPIYRMFREEYDGNIKLYFDDNVVRYVEFETEGEAVMFLLRW